MIVCVSFILKDILHTLLYSKSGNVVTYMFLPLIDIFGDGIDFELIVYKM